MQGNKTTFIKGNTFYKEYTKNEFIFLKMLHGETGLPINLEIVDEKQFITMPKGHVISIDTIEKSKRNSISLRNIIAKNIPFILKQIALLNQLGIYYSDCLQFLLYNNRLYLIDMDTAFFTKINYDYNNYHLLNNFLQTFNINNSFIQEALYYLELFKEEDIKNTLYNEQEKELYNRLNDPTMKKNYIYYSKNKRHIQIDIKHIHIYGETGNMIITETILNPEEIANWELIKIV